MPLDKSGTPQAFQNNMKKEMRGGKPQPQALAIAYAAQGQRKPKPKRFDKVKDFLNKK